MCPSAPRVCSEPGGQKPVLSLSLDRIWWSGTHRYHPDLQMSCRDLTTWQGARIVVLQWLPGYMPYLSQHWFMKWLGTEQGTPAIIWTNDDRVLWCRMVSPGHNSFLWHPCITLMLRQNDRHFADDTFKSIFLNEYVRISIKFSIKFAPKGPVTNIPAFVQIMAWRRPGNKPLSEPMMVKLPTHICITWPQ